MPLQTYRDLDVWQAGIELVEKVYFLAKSLPDDERYGMTSQLRRAVISIPLNIAEGYGRSHRGDYLRCLSFSQGSLKEVETLLIIIGRLKCAERFALQPCWELCQRIGKMLTRLMQSLSGTTRPPTPTPYKKPNEQNH